MLALWLITKFEWTQRTKFEWFTIDRTVALISGGDRFSFAGKAITMTMMDGDQLGAVLIQVEAANLMPSRGIISSAPCIIVMLLIEECCAIIVKCACVFALIFDYVRGTALDTLRVRATRVEVNTTFTIKRHRIIHGPPCGRRFGRCGHA